MHSVNMRIADIVTRVEWERDDLLPHLDDAERKFLCEPSEPDFLMTVRVGELPHLEVTRNLFECVTWRLDETPDGRLLSLGSQRRDPLPFRVIELNYEVTRATMYLRDDLAGRAPQGSPPGTFLPFEYPGMELILYWRLVRERGLGLHAAGIIAEGEGLLLSGMSGAGKSTLSEVWQSRGATVLSDDRIGVRPDGDGYRMYGTPWHGTLRVCDPSDERLRAILFLEHGERNELESVEGVAACAMLLARSFPPYFAGEDLSQALTAASEIIQTVPCYALKFVPDASAIDFINQALA